MRTCRLPIAKLLLRLAGTTLSSALLLVALSVAALAHAGSVYVPVDSWVYAAAERLAVLTDTQGEVLGMRPWTRAQFAHFLESARERQHDSEAEKLQSALEQEFTPELNVQVEKLALESAYTRSTQIGGTPLRDSYHFGQTIVDDFGRPYGQGFNAISGASGYVQERAGLLYVRGEYQHGASLRSPSEATMAELATADGESSSRTEWPLGGSEVDNPRLLDAYVGASFGHFTGTLGKQSLWWGPAAGGSMHYSNNIEPIWMARLTNDVPFKIPFLGKARLDMFYGKLQGHRYEPQVWVHGEKVSIEPFHNFEIGFTRTVVFLGVNYPFSFDRLWKSYFSVGDNNATAQIPNNPGSRQGGVDFSWKLPKIPVTLYTDSYCDDDPSPLANPKRSAFRNGLYIAHFPGALAKLDLRVEGAYTVSESRDLFQGFNYWKGDYRDGYTNKGLLIGDATVGRAGVSWQAWSTYWFSARNKLQVSYLNHYINPKFLAGGGTQNSFKILSDMQLKHSLEVELGVQPERYVMPLLTGSRSPQYDVAGWVGVKYSPGHKVEN